MTDERMTPPRDQVDPLAERDWLNEPAIEMNPQEAFDAGIITDPAIIAILRASGEIA